MVTAFPASINDKARVTFCFSFFDSGELSLGQTCFARVRGIRRADLVSCWCSLLGVASDVGVVLDGLDAEESLAAEFETPGDLELELFHRCACACACVS